MLGAVASQGRTYIPEVFWFESKYILIGLNDVSVITKDAYSYFFVPIWDIAVLPRSVGLLTT